MIIARFLIFHSIAMNCFTKMLTYYGGKEGSYAKYQVWNAADFGTIKFRFKTSYPNGLIIYVDDRLERKSISKKRRDGNFLKLHLVDSKLELAIRVTIGNSANRQSYTSRAVLGNNLDDNNFHYVEIQRSGYKTTFILDGKKKKVQFNEKILKINSEVYIGGVPSTPRIFMDAEVTYEDKFIGCLDNLQYDNGLDHSSSSLTPAKLLEEYNITRGCRNMCLIKPTETCHNKGRCLNKYIKTGCDCRGTGFTGLTCLEQADSIHFRGISEDYFIWTPAKEQNNYNTDIFLRFKTIKSAGIIFLAIADIFDNGYILLELHRNSLHFHFKMKDTKEHVIVLGDGKSNRTHWRYVQILKNRNRLELKLDDGDSARVYLRQLHEDNTLALSGYLNITKVFVGGVDSTISAAMPRSRTFFNGCIQDVFVNRVDIIKQAIEVQNKKKYRHLKRGCNHNIIDKDFSEIYPERPSLETQDANKTWKQTDVSNPTKNNFTNVVLKTVSHPLNEQFIWIIVVASSIPFIILIVIVLLIRRYYRKKVRKEQKQCEHYLRRQAAARANEDTIPLRQKCIRNEIDTKCDLHTFSPVRRDFYVSEFDTILRSHDATQSTLLRSQDHVQSSSESVTYGHDTIVSYDSVNQRVESLFRDKNAMNRCRKISCNSHQSSIQGRQYGKNEQRYAQPLTNITR